MNKEPLSRRLSKGIFYLLSSSIASLGLNVVTVAFIARALGVENFGLYSAILSFVGLFQFLSDFGLNRTLLKFGSVDKVRAQVSFGNALFLKGILILPTLLLITFFGTLAGYGSKEMFILELFAISLIFDSFGTVFSSIRRILGSFKLISFFRVVRTTINLLIIIIAISIKNSVLSLALANAVLSSLIFVISLLNTIFLLKPKLKLSLIKEFFKDSVIFSLSDFFLSIYAKISTVLLSFFSDLHTVGIFSAALRFTKIANLLPTQIRFALLPTLYRIMDDDKQTSISKRKKVFLTILKWMIIFATPLVISIYFFSNQIIHLIFGAKYDLSTSLVKLFSLFVYLRFIQTPFSLFYIAMNKHKNMVYFQGSTSALNVILNLILIPSYSMYGAAIATIVSEAFFGFLLIVIGRKYLIWDLAHVSTILIKTMLAGFISIALVTFLLSKTNIFVQIFLLFVSYLVCLFIMKTFTEDDRKLFRKIFAKNVIISK